MSSKRERKTVESFTPEEATTKDKLVIVEGAGVHLSELPSMGALQKIAGDEDLLKMTHMLLFKTPGTKNSRKKDIRQFSGFEDTSSKAKEERAEKLLHNKKWHVNHLKDLAGLLGLEKGGSKADLVTRVLNFLDEPDASISKASAGGSTPKKRKASTSAKGEKKGKKEKKEKKEKVPKPLSAYFYFSKLNREDVKQELADAGEETGVTDVAKALGAKWKEVSDAEKAKLKAAAIKEFEKEHGKVGTQKPVKAAAKMGKKKPKKAESSEDEGEEEEEEEEAGSDDDEEEED
ncbi:unnamed protein product [Chrysoparadoxa australica]